MLPDENFRDNELMSAISGICGGLKLYRYKVTYSLAPKWAGKTVSFTRPATNKQCIERVLIQCPNLIVTSFDKEEIFKVEECL